MKLCSIASGSSGNCIYVANDDTNLLVDAGISKKRIVEGLDSIGVDVADIDGILVTHEHVDHIKSVGVMARAYNVPIYGTYDTLKAIHEYKSTGNIDQSLYRPIKADNVFNIKSLAIRPFATSHDAVDPVCYTFHSNDKKIGVATDLGEYDDYIISNLEGCNVLLLEANYDRNMLQVGPYPYYLKQRIVGNKGHLSNVNTGELLKHIISDKLKYIFLGHLSKENNYPELAYETVKVELEDELRDSILKVAHRDKPSELVTV